MEYAFKCRCFAFATTGCLLVVVSLFCAEMTVTTTWALRSAILASGILGSAIATISLIVYMLKTIRWS